MSQTLTIKYKRTEANETELLAGLKSRQEWAVRRIYQTQYRAIKKMVYKFNNTSLDPQDIFQEGIARLMLNIHKGNFREDCAISTYLNSICRNICLKELNRKKEVLQDQLPPNIEFDNSEKFELLDVLLKLKNKLNKNCQSIIDLRFKLNNPVIKTETENELNKLLPFDDIAKQLNISAINARKRFSRCLQELRELTLNEPALNYL